MTTIGVDIGTGSVRVCLNNPDNFKTAFKPIKTNKHDTFSNYITQSSQEIYQCILALLKELVNEPVVSISFTATCSMVVMEKVSIASGIHLKPCAVNFEGDDRKQDIILWMDNRSVGQTSFLNEKVNEKDLSKVGGKFIPEMGLPKLKWLQDNIYEDIVCFELYDWFSYLFLVGGYDEDGLVPYVVEPIEPMQEHPTESEAMDGSIKGWTTEFLKQIGIDSHISIGRSEFNLSTSGLLPIGIPLGYIHENAYSLREKIAVANGCIDCYAGWLSTIEPGFAAENHLSMIAGTSTCFILSTPSSQYNPITGIWGPFSQLLALPLDIFEFGQPATGKLFEQLFANYTLVVSSLNTDDIFALLEHKTATLEVNRNSTITELIKSYFWYIDQYGNRSPYNDFSMSEMIIDGFNSSDNLESITNGTTLMGLVIRYNLVLEFLCFQTRQILEIIQASNGPLVDSITVSGSQGNNKRFMRLLATVTGKQVKILKLSTNVKYNVVKGSAIISTIGHNLLTGCKNYQNTINSSIPTDVDYDIIYPDHSIAEFSPLLDKKYNVFLDMAMSQQNYRRIINSM